MLRAIHIHHAPLITKDDLAFTNVVCALYVTLLTPTFLTVYAHLVSDASDIGASTFLGVAIYATPGEIV